MRVYRLASQRHNPRTGWGAAKWGGRWNSPGRPVIYTASSLALACLEVLVHIQDITNIPPYFYWELSVPEWAVTKWTHEDDSFIKSKMATVGYGDVWLANVPTGERPGSLELHASGTPYWQRLARRYQHLLNRLGIARKPGPVLQVPSLVIPQEWNYLIAPEHVQFDAIEWLGSKPFLFDPRLLPGLR